MRELTRYKVGAVYDVQLSIWKCAIVTFQATLIKGEYSMNGATPRLWFDNGVYICSDLVDMELLYNPEDSLLFQPKSIEKEIIYGILKWGQIVTLFGFLIAGFFELNFLCCIYALMSIMCGWGKEWNNV